MKQVNKEDAINVLSGELQPCAIAPLTSFFRDGRCTTCSQDVGSHTVGVEITTDFLEYSRFAGNDLSSHQIEFGLPGQKEGDRWCLCAARWLQAYDKGMAPKIFLKNTQFRALETIPLDP